ncbi:hypothetical protein OESDEN_03309 [Oesophagostomum dentatum]|uniref:Cadherin domain-containing protein n=1 Tax=Oesophagostomum dentatum TaxID=61180 RepID=A0A0B1TGS4_OESDE|nr:hypothetical protein OESDEN_03309 [Oesophagostomum dentatum]
MRFGCNTPPAAPPKQCGLANMLEECVSLYIVGVTLYGVKIVEGPHHGTITLDGQPCSSFDYSQLLARSVIYRHDGSETTQDQLEFQLDITSKKTDFPWMDSTTYVLRIRINPVNDPPELTEAKGGHVIKISAKGSRTLSPDHILLSDPDDGPDKVTVHDEGIFEKGVLRLIAKDSDAKSQVLTLHTVSTPVEVRLKTNTGDLDNRLISFKLHFMQYSIINDFFLFRVISPAISSESLRFEIIFVPTQTSIQLVNRTVVVQEGEAAMITSDSLSLATPDDSFFVFTLALAPIQGALVLKSDSGNKTLAVGANFTTRDIAEERLIYSHSGSESRTDRLHLIAESAFRKGRRIPFWMSFSIIPVNDNKPRLQGSDTVQVDSCAANRALDEFSRPFLQMVERGERILYPYLLDWVDDDSDGAPLQFNFYQPIKDVAVLSTVSPYHPMTVFTEKDLQQGKIMLRHLGHKSNFTIKYVFVLNANSEVSSRFFSYTVSDGKHTVEGLLRIVASEPFVRLGESLLEYCCLPGDTPNLRE